MNEAQKPPNGDGRLSSGGARRHRALQQELDRVLPILIREYAPEKILVFGSFANGQSAEWSDLDLVVIKNTPQRFFDRLADVINMVKPQVGMDILVYTPAEWETMCATNAFIREEILGKGRLLYAA